VIEVSVRDLRNHGGAVLDSVLRGERVTVMRAGEPVAELRPVAAIGTPSTDVIESWATISVLDFEALRADLDAVLDPPP
jgi:prevent-host-death family protein